MQTPTPRPPENQEIAAELRYLDSIAPKTITVRQYASGAGTGQEFYLDTAWGNQLVTGIHDFSDGPWIITGKGFSQSSFAVCMDTRLKVGRAS